jgi:hypothetical protein
MKTILACCNLHIYDYVAVGSLHGITHLMLSHSEMPGHNSIVKVPFTCVCRTLYGHWSFCLVCKVFHLFPVPFVEGYSCIDDTFDFFVCDFHVLNVLLFVPISNQRNIKEHVHVECETSGATS